MSRVQVLAVLYQLLTERPFCPTVREVAERAGCSVGAAHRTLATLRSLGEVDWMDRQSRTLHLTQRGREAVLGGG